MSLSARAAEAKSKEPPHYYIPDVPADMSRVEFYLLTVGLGDDLAGRFGHTGLRIFDPESRMDVVFNWGKFVFDDAGFAWKFFRGSLVYSLGVRTFKGEVEHQQAAQRRLIQQHMNLTTAQKRHLMEKIAWNAIPANRDFPYQYWFKNCATIPRDYLDETLSGQLSAKFVDKKTERRFRDYVRENLAAIPFVVPLLDVLMNGNIDRPITMWEEMFLPAKLQTYLSSMPSVNDDGQLVSGTSLLGKEEVLLDFEESYAAPFNDYVAAVFPIVAPLLIAFLAMWFASRRKPVPAIAPWIYRSIGFATLSWGMLFGFLGLTLLFNWGFSGHPDGWRNPNLLLFWPIDGLLVPLGWRLLRSGGPVKDRWPVVGAFKIFVVGHLMSVVVLIFCAGAGVVTQDIWRVVIWGGLTTALLFTGLLKVGFRASVPAPTHASARTMTGSARPRQRRSRRTT